MERAGAETVVLSEFGALTLGRTIVLLGGLGLASYHDWRSREVGDRLWQLLAGFGAIVGGVLLAPDGLAALAAWSAVSLLAIEQLVPWDLAVERWNDRLPGYLELGGFLAVALFLAILGITQGIDPSGLPLPAIAAFASIVLGRGLFEARLLYGGADAKALIAAGLVVPISSSPWVPLPEAATRILGIYPFALTLLMNAALLAVAIPIVLAIRNVRRGEFDWRRGFSGYMIPVADLADRFVWLKDPTFRSEGTEEAGTTEEDRALREKQKAQLEARGVTRTWVTPQIPFVVLLFFGALVGAVLGNLLFDVFTLW